jgi:hypothetical protein
LKRECQSCAARTGQAEFPLPRKRGDPVLCADCAAEAAREPGMPRRIIRRARYRAALRHRAASPQGDLVDLVVRAP